MKLERLFSWRSRRAGGIFLEIGPLLAGVVATVVVATALAAMGLWLHALAAVGAGLVWGAVTTISTLASHGLIAAIRFPRLRALGLHPPRRCSAEAEDAAQHAEAALDLAVSFRHEGRFALAHRMAQGVADLMKQLHHIDEHYRRIIALPGERNREVSERCAQAIRRVDEALCSFCIDLATAGGADEFSAARVDETLRKAAQARAAAEAVAEVSLEGAGLASTGGLR